MARETYEIRRYGKSHGVGEEYVWRCDDCGANMNQVVERYFDTDDDDTAEQVHRSPVYGRQAGWCRHATTA